MKVAGFLHVLGLVLLFGACLLSLFSLVVGLPGTVLIVIAATVYAWATEFVAVGWSTILWLAALAVAGEGLELVASGAGAGGAGGRPSRRATIAAIVGAIVGGIAGTPFLFGVGSLLGALAGAFAGAALAVRSEGATLDESLATGLAAMKGRLLGFVLKAAIAVAMILLLLTAVW